MNRFLPLILLAVLALISLVPASASRAQDAGEWRSYCDDQSCYVYQDFTISGSGSYEFYFDMVWAVARLIKFDSGGIPIILYGAVVTIDNNNRFEFDDCGHNGCQFWNEGEIEDFLLSGDGMTIQVNDGNGWHSHSLSLRGFTAAYNGSCEE